MSSSGDKESKVEKLSQKYLGKVAFEHGRGIDFSQTGVLIDQAAA